MARGRHKKKSRTKHGRRHGKTKHRRRKSRSNKRHRTRERRHKKRGRKEEEEVEEGVERRKRSKSVEAILKQRPRIQIRHPEMTDAAMNENLGNIVLVKNRHKQKSVGGGSVGNAKRGELDRLLSGPPGPGSTTTAGTTTPTTTTTPVTTLPSSDLPDAQPIPLAVQQAQALAYPPGTVPPQQQPAAAAPTLTSTTTPSTTTYGTTGITPVQTGSTDVSMTGATTTTTTTTTTTKTSGAPAQPSAEKTDEVTKKEVVDGEKHGCDRLRKWKTYMEKTLDGGVESMVAEFRVIRGHIPPMATRFSFDANMDKNRFEDVVCIDHTRVRLDQGRYIHASWVAITGGRKAILTQLPRPETSGDFWQMILDTDAQAILLILTHAEYKMFHANATFPQEQDFLTCHDSKITVGEFKRVVINRDWTMHVLSVRSGDKRRFLHLHHYSGWVHGRQPPRILDLWQIQSVFRKYNHPHVYMSLSGCGRAGTYAAFEVRTPHWEYPAIAHERLHSDHFSKLSIADCVCRARNGRMHSVQRPIQMQTIHASIMEHIMGNGFSTVLSHGRRKKYKEFATRFNKCAELQEDL